MHAPHRMALVRFKPRPFLLGGDQNLQMLLFSNEQKFM